jgi:hypothetical protein
MEEQKLNKEQEQALRKTDVVCSALIEAFNEGRIAIRISGCKYENWLSLKVYVDGEYVFGDSGVLY